MDGHPNPIVHYRNRVTSDSKDICTRAKVRDGSLDMVVHVFRHYPSTGIGLVHAGHIWHFKKLVKLKYSLIFYHWTSITQDLKEGSKLAFFSPFQHVGVVNMLHNGVMLSSMEKTSDSSCGMQFWRCPGPFHLVQWHVATHASCPCASSTCPISASSPFRSVVEQRMHFTMWSSPLFVRIPSAHGILHTHSCWKFPVWL